MSQPLTEWKVLPHGSLTRVEDNILTVEGTIRMPLGDFSRRMTVVRLRDGRLVIFNAIALDEEQMRVLENFGKPAFLIVPNGHHRLDARIWKERYPDIRVVTPAGARAKVEETVSVDSTHADFDDPAVTFVTVPGTGDNEAALEVAGSNGSTLILNDMVGNLRKTSGMGGWLLRLMGFSGDEPHIPLPVKMAMLKDKGAFAAQLRRWAELPSLKRIVVSHGVTIDQNAPATLRKLAASLG
jgi:hypothetical protein